MDNKIFVGGISWDTDDAGLEAFVKNELPEVEVTEVKIIIDRMTNRSRGFGFVTFNLENSSLTIAQIIEKLDGKELDGRTLKVTEARPQQSRE